MKKNENNIVKTANNANSFELAGFVNKVFETKTLDSSTKIAFALGVQSPDPKDSGSKLRADVSVVAFDKDGSMERIIKEGHKICVKGFFGASQWINEKNERRSRVAMIATEATLLAVAKERKAEPEAAPAEAAA